MKKKPKRWFVLWFTGLSGSGKSTVADALMQKLESEGFSHIERLDGDLVRGHLTKDLWFSKEDRFTNIERVTFLAKLLSKHEVWVLATFVSPYKEIRAYVKKEVTNFVEIFVNAPLEVCEQRDVKWLYKKVRDGHIQEFTWINDPYEAPAHPDIELKTDEHDLNVCIDQVYQYLLEQKYL